MQKSQIQSPPSVAVIIPAFNEEKTIRQVVEQVLQYCNHVIVINDGSSDNTKLTLNGLPLTLLDNPVNRGKGTSLLRGFDYARRLNVAAVITIDADTQHDPHDIPKFITTMRHYPQHIIIGARVHNTANAPRARYRANRIADFFISWAAGKRVIDSQSGFRLYPIQLIQDCLQRFHYRNFTFESNILISSLRRNYHIKHIEIRSHYPENIRVSHYKPVNDTLKITLMIIWKIISHGLCLPGLWRALAKGEKGRNEKRQST